MASVDKTRTTITAKECATYLGISYWKLNDLCKDSQMPHTQIGNRRLFRKEVIDSWLQTKECASIA